MLALYLSMLDTEDEREKFTLLYDEYKEVCLRKALALCNNQCLAEDAVHNAFIDIIKHKEKYLHLSGRDFRALVGTITKYKMINLLREQNKFINTPIDEMGEELVSDEVLPELQLINKENYTRLAACLEILDEDSMIVLEMKYFLGMSYEEISEELGINKKTVDMRLYRAKKKLSAAMKEDVSKRD